MGDANELVSKDIMKVLEYIRHSQVKFLLYLWQQNNQGRSIVIYSPICGPLMIAPIELSDEKIIGYGDGAFTKFEFTSDGRLYGTSSCAAECLLFPSEKEHDWEKFDVSNQDYFIYDGIPSTEVKIARNKKTHEKYKIENIILDYECNRKPFKDKKLVHYAYCMRDSNGYPVNLSEYDHDRTEFWLE